ncbi:MAG: RHS repeat domain-containing protein [Spirochaetia bacterium]
MEYSPYGESWIDQETDSRALLPFKFTSKELDSETRLYYRGARYLDSQTSRRMSADPAMEDYLPVARNRNRGLQSFEPCGLSLRRQQSFEIQRSNRYLDRICAA